MITSSVNYIMFILTTVTYLTW